MKMEEGRNNTRRIMVQAGVGMPVVSDRNDMAVEFLNAAQ